MKKNWVKVILVIVVCFLSIIKVDAVSGDFSVKMPPSPYIDGQTKVVITGVENYKLYSQFIKIDDNKYNAIYNAVNNYNQLYKEYETYYKNAPNQEDYEAGETDKSYEEAVREYTAKLNEYKKNVGDALQKVYDELPDFNEENWSEMKDDIITFPKDFKEDDRAVLYVKLDNKDTEKVSYGFSVITNKGGSGSTSDTPTEDELSIWDQLVSGIINNKTISETYKKGEYTVTFDNDIRTILKIKIVKDSDGTTYQLSLNYDNGIVTYQTPTTEPERYELVHKNIINVVLEEIAEIYGYNSKEFINWIMTHKDLTMANNGIEYKAETKDVENTKVTFINDLKVDIINGIKGFTNGTSEDDEKNPSTENNKTDSSEGKASPTPSESNRGIQPDE